MSTMQPGPHQHQPPQQPQYPPPGYGHGYPRPPKKNNGPVIALVAGLAVLLVAGIGVVVYLNSGDPADSPGTSAAAEPGPADKYTDLPECAALNAKLTLFPDLMPKAAEKKKDTQAARGDGDLQTVRVKCSWRTREPEATVSADIVLFVSDGQPQHNGTKDGAQYWLSIDRSAEDRVEGENVLFPKSTGGDGCYGRFSDGNVLVTMNQFGPGLPGGASHGPDMDQCRDNLSPKGKELVAALKG
ncbi:hypothetical protein [Crossiella sp. CA198]|uniref:hypothetical protein n=1 Tax=Crossiella sp. CA198 TaxID=3455607 RepID=UPI003F8D30D5